MIDDFDDFERADGKPAVNTLFDRLALQRNEMTALQRIEVYGTDGTVSSDS